MIRAVRNHVGLSVRNHVGKAAVTHFNWKFFLAICWIFGGKKFYGCLEQMLGFKIHSYFYWCWMAISPAFMTFIFVFYFVKYTPIKYAGYYEYPWWGEVLGFMISISSMIWVPGDYKGIFQVL